MPNWCSASYVIEGDAKEIKQLYELMEGRKRLRDAVFFLLPSSFIFALKKNGR